MSSITPARLEVAAATRALVHAVAGRDVDDETLRQVGDLIAQAHALLAAAPRRRRGIPDFSAFARVREEEPALHAMADRAVAGPANPVSVDIRTRIEDGVAMADVCFGPAFEGAPGRVHGGLVAAVFDDVLGSAMAQARTPGFTGRLTVHYRAPVPVDRRVVFRAWPGTREGRKLHAHAEARLDDLVLATADALFVLVDIEHFATHADDLLQRGVGGE